MLIRNIIAPHSLSTSLSSNGFMTEQMLWISKDTSGYDSSSLGGAASILANELATTGILSDQGGRHDDYYNEVTVATQKYGDKGPWEHRKYPVLKLPGIELVKIVPDITPGEPIPLLHLAAFFVAQALENGETQFEGTEVELANGIRSSYPAYRVALGTIVGAGC